MHEVMTPELRREIFRAKEIRGRIQRREAKRYDATRSDFYVAVRLAPLTEHSHLAVIRQTFSPAQGKTHYTVSGIHRFDKGCPVHEVAKAAKSVYCTPEIQDAFARALVVDHTFAGLNALDTFNAADVDYAPITVSDSGPVEACNVPRHELVTMMQTLLQERRFKLACDSAEARAFMDEAASYRIRSRDSGAVAYQTAREGRIACVATAIWFAEWYRFEAWGYIAGATIT